MTSRRDFLRRAPTGLAALALAPVSLDPGRSWREAGRVEEALRALAAGRPAPTGGSGAALAMREGTALVYDDRFLAHRLPDRGGAPHPERPERLVRMMAELERTGVADETQRLPITVDPMPFVRGVHERDHVRSVERLEVTADVAELAVAGALSAVDAVATGQVRNAFCAIRPPGHHANNTGAEEGFCFYSNVAVAARYAQIAHGVERVLIIDWDYHHGNGTQNAFYDDPNVLFFSTHDWRAYPQTGDPALVGEGPGEGLNINADLMCGATDRDMLRHWDRLLIPAVERFRPQFVLVSAGFDSRRDDLLGCFDVTDDAFRRMTRMTMELADDYCEGQVVSLLEGGYNVDGTAIAAAVHVRELLEG